MGLISAMACAICWDRNCNHTWEEQEIYCEAQSKKKKLPKTLEVKSDTNHNTQYDKLFNLTFEAVEKLEKIGKLDQCSKELREWWKVARALGRI